MSFRGRPCGVWRILAMGYLALVTVALLWPSGANVAEAKHWLGLWFMSENTKDVFLNLVMFVPLSWAATLGWQRVPWWQWALAACLMSAAGESVQWLIPELTRRGNLLNVVQNSLGAWAGAYAAHLWLRRRHSHEAQV